MPGSTPSAKNEFELEESLAEYETEDSSWGEGAASALRTLKKRQQRRVDIQPNEERPSGN